MTGTSNYFNGYLDELRISKGIARWTGSFTPPDAPYVIPTYASQLYTFDTSIYTNLTKLNLDLLASATASAGNGVTAKIWNKNTLAWVALDSLTNTSAAMPGTVATQSLTASLTDYVDASGIVRVLVHATNPSVSGTNAVLSADYIKLSVWGEVLNIVPAAPTLVSPANASYINDSTPTLSAQYSDSNPGDVGTTNYRVTSGTAQDCLDGVSVVASGASAATASNNAATTWTSGSAIGADGIYHWCTQNNDGAATSGWTNMGSFTLDTAAPTLDTTTTFSGWYTSNQTATFTYSDALSGIASGNNPTCNLTTDGASQTCNVTPNVCDNATNCNTTLVTSNGVNLDKAAPTTSGAVTAGTLGANGWYTSDLIYTLTPADATSGVAATVYCFDTNNSCDPTTSYAAPLTISTESATNYVRWKSTDNAGNVQTIQSSGALKLDKTAPLLTSISASSDKVDYFYASALTVSGGTNYFNSASGAGAGQNITLTAVATETNPDGWSCATAFADTPTKDTLSIYTQTYSVEANAGAQNNIICTFTDLAGHADTATFNFLADNAGPLHSSSTTTYHILNHAWGENVGWLTLNGGGYGLVIDNATRVLSGKAWNENTGWINFDNPTNTLALSASGVFTGNVWSENMGWLSFSGVGYGVTIDAQGVLAGEAWNENTGWITFTPAVGENVTTAWLPDTAPNHGTAVSGPEARDAVTGSALYTNSLTVNLFWNATDALSGIAEYLVTEATSAPTVDAAAWQTATPTQFTLSATDAVKTLYFWLKDYVGNISAQQTNTIKYDTTAPTTSGAITAGTLGANGWYTSDIIYTLTPADATSGIAATVYCFDTNNSCDPTTSGTSVSLTTESATNYVRWKSTDNAGNVQTIQSSGALKLDKTAPSGGSTTYINTYSTTTSQTINISRGSDAPAGLSATDADYLLEYQSAALANGACGAYSAWTDASVLETAGALNYSLTVADGFCYQFRYTVKDLAGNTTIYIGTDTTKIDTTAPTVQTTTLTSPNGGESWGGVTSHAITWNAADFTDSHSALLASPITLAYTTNGTDWTTIAANEANDGIYTWTTPNLTASTVQVRVTATNNAGLTASDASAANFSLTSTTNANTLLLTSGDHQIGQMNTALGSELVVRATNGFDVGVANIDVTFTLASVPDTFAVNASGQAFGNGTLGTHINNTATTRTMRTDADGYASVVFALGDRAGDYTVATDFSGNTSGVRTFTATEREYFQLTFNNADLASDLNPVSNPSATQSLTLSILTNAVSYELTTLPDAWPTRTEGAGALVNWDGTHGFGWDNNGTTPTTTAFATNAGAPAATVVFSCSGDTCQTTKTPTLDFTTVIDYTNPAGIYANQMLFRGVGVVY